MAVDPSWANPNTIRSKVVLEIASELVSDPDQAARQAKVLLRESPGRDWSVALFGSSTNEGIHEVVAGRAHLGIINPSAPLTLAYRGHAPFEGSQPIRAIGVIPSADQLIFAVRPETGLTTFEDIASTRFPLRVSTRGTPDHCIHFILDHIAAAAGFTFAEMKSWGGELRREGRVPTADGPKFKALLSGEIDAIFDEGSDEWLAEALAAGLRVLPLAESTLRKLELMGYRRAVLSRAQYPLLSADVPTIDFSGWPIFVNAELDDGLVRRICAALDARRGTIPWQGDGPLPVERMSRNESDTPLDIPLHPAAELYWRERGYLT
jgi:TRAP-type uncharacterized transport system substrate-binding protein